MDSGLTSWVGYVCLLTSLVTEEAEIVAAVEVLINADPPAVKFGQPLVVNCSSTCEIERIIMEGIKDKNPKRQDQWLAYSSPRIETWSVTMVCSVQCVSEGKNTTYKRIPVYSQDLNITSPLEALEINKMYSLECIGPKVYPKNRLLLKWLRGSEIVQCNSTEQEGSSDERLRSVFHFTARTSDDGQVYTCSAEVDLGSNATLPITNASVTLQTYYKPRSLIILVQNQTLAESSVHLRNGDSLTLVCDAQGNPKPTFTWKYPLKQNAVTNSSGVLRIFNATTENNGMYTCIAVNKFGMEEKKVNIRVKVNMNGFEVQIDTNSPVVKFGDSLEVICNTTCTDPIMTVEYKPGINPNRTQGRNWIRDRFQNVQKWDFTVPCSVICPSLKQEQEDKKVVTVYNQDLDVITPAEVMEINQNYNLECIGPRVYPNNKIILTWLRGNEIIQHNFTNEKGFPDEDVRLRNVLQVTARKSDDGQVYTCLAELDLGSNTTKQIAKLSETLQTYSFPEPPTILNKTPVEVNQVATLTCEVPNVYPAEKMRVRWFLDGKEWNSVTSGSDHTTVWAILAWAPQVPGWTELTCTADFGNYTSVMKNDSINIEMYVFSDPEIQVPTSNEGIPVNVTCSVFNVSGTFQLRLKVGRDVLKSESGSSQLTIYHTVYPLAELNGQEYTCEAELMFQFHSESIVKQQSATLNVQYSPDGAQISEEQEWIEGKSQTLTCRGKGNPDPQVLWRRDGKMISSNETFHIPLVQLEHGGRYMCVLYNEFGSMNSSFHAEILYKPQNTSITINNRTVAGYPVSIENGDEVTMTCHSSGNPRAILEWDSPSQGNKVETNHSGVLHISHATSEHKGLYRCRARNVHGTDEKVVELRMKDETWWILTIALAALVLPIIISAVVFYLVNRARKTGEYEVLNATPNRNQEIPQGNENKEMFPLEKVNSDHFVINNHSQKDSTNTSGVTPIGSTVLTQ